MWGDTEPASNGKWLRIFTCMAIVLAIVLAIRMYL